MERATIRGAIARSWRLTRGRFWPILGIVVLIQLIFGAMAQIVTLPFGLIGGLLTQFIAPTGDADTSAIISVIVTLGLAEIITLLIQSVAIVVQATATSILYIDCRMRREGLDLDLLAYVERRDAGAQDLADPYTLHIGRTMARPPMPAYAPYGPAQPYATAPPYGAAYPPYGAGSAPTAPAQPPYATPGSGPYAASATGPYPPPAAAPTSAPPASAPPASAPAPTQWAAPGERPDEQGMP
ncbi:glycerophosphoryl diester phosphodiesterase membrane domain-containing protein [Microbacterium elymi]|uniref:glycerophosphoryl diester phosphodiesterase membrane domain-containing protein n=1 Tax=Microbacterium elymi TaxID=2909587 RepID=UPI00338D544E